MKTRRALVWIVLLALGLTGCQGETGSRLESVPSSHLAETEAAQVSTQATSARTAAGGDNGGSGAGGNHGGHPLVSRSHPAGELPRAVGLSLQAGGYPAAGGYSGDSA